jgi:lipopolysaccharide export system protein LptA
LPPEDLTGERMQVLADNQEFNDQDQTFVATGNVIVRYMGSELKADKVQVNLGRAGRCS